MSIYSWAYKQGMKKIRKQIEKVIKKKRLVFLGDNLISYTDKEGNKNEYDFDKMAQVAVDVGGWSENMATIGITNQDIVNILVEKYAEQQKK